MPSPRLDIAAILAANPLVLAPLAGWTDLPFRLLTRPFGVGLAYSEMVSAEGLVRRDYRTWSLLRSHPADAPLLIQLFGHDPGRMALAARLVEASGYAGVDINMGCPVTKVVKQGAGGALMRDTGRAEMIMKAVREAVSIPVTVKIRTGYSREMGDAGLEVALAARRTGLEMVCLHPRYTRQGFSGSADWSVIGRAAAGLDIPVVGSGDIKDPADAVRMLDSGCAGAMIGRAAVGRPWIFDQVRAALAGREIRAIGPEERRRTMIRHLELMIHYQGPDQAWLKFKGLSGGYLKGLPGAKAIRTALHTSRDVDHARELLEDYFDGSPKAMEER